MGTLDLASGPGSEGSRSTAVPLGGLYVVRGLCATLGIRARFVILKNFGVQRTGPEHHTPQAPAVGRHVGDMAARMRNTAVGTAPGPAGPQLALQGTNVLSTGAVNQGIRDETSPEAAGRCLVQSEIPGTWCRFR